MRTFSSDPDLFATAQVSTNSANGANPQKTNHHNYSIMNSLVGERDLGTFFGKSKDSPEFVGFNMKQYEEELVKLRNDNFSLKLRIHLLEERCGLVVRPEDKEDKENVFR